MTSLNSLPDGAQEVRDILLKRAAGKSQPGSRTDAHKVALCIEGGAMRGVVSAGMVVAFEQLGLLGTIDAVFGSSAGAMNGAYFLAGQAAFGTTIYYQDNIGDRSFIDLLRPLHGRPLVDLNFLTGHVMEDAKRLDVERVLTSDVPLHVIATHVPTGDRHIFNSWNSREDFLDCLRASASMPIVAGPPFPYRGGHYWDALLSEAVPVSSAEEAGFTHVVALMTRPAGTLGPSMSTLERLFIVPRLRRVAPLLAARYAARGRVYAETVSGLWQGRGPLRRAHILPIGPRGPVVGKLERRREALVDGAEQGFRAVASIFGCEVGPVSEVLCGFGPTGHTLSRLG